MVRKTQFIPVTVSAYRTFTKIQADTGLMSTDILKEYVWKTQTIIPYKISDRKIIIE